MAQINQTASMAAFQAASSIDPASLRELIVAVTTITVLAWSTFYIRRALAYGWKSLDMMHVGTGFFLILILSFFVFWVLAQYGAGA